MTHYFRPSLETPRIFLYRDPVDFRKASLGLAAIVERELGHNVFDGALYAFTNRQRNKIKCLFWEDNGFVLYYKALAKAAEELVREHCISDATWAVLAERYTTKQLIELVFMVANYTLLAMVNNSLGIQTETEVEKAWKPTDEH